MRNTSTPDIHVVGVPNEEGDIVVVAPGEAVEVLPFDTRRQFRPVGGMAVRSVTGRLSHATNDIAHKIMLGDAEAGGGISRVIGSRVEATTVQTTDEAIEIAKSSISQ